MCGQKPAMHGDKSFEMWTKGLIKHPHQANALGVHRFWIYYRVGRTLFSSVFENQGQEVEKSRKGVEPRRIGREASHL